MADQFRDQISEKLAHCIRCGFCLESCPTFKITGAELHSPRGRIYLIRGVLEGEIALSETREALDACLGCRACETACPSGVEYGSILEYARSELEAHTPTRAKQMLLKNLTDPKKAQRMIAAASLLPNRKPPALIANLIGLPPQVARTPKPKPLPTYPSLAESDLPPVRGEVAILLGCVMRVLYPGVHEALRRLLRRVGYTSRDLQTPCCGSMDAHAGYPQEARKKLQNLLNELPKGMPLILDSAGCGSHLKDHKVPNTFDATEFLLANGLKDALSCSPGLSIRATYHDACHLAHGQRITQPPRELIQAIPGLTLVELPESDMCCGSGGIYNALQPQMASSLLDRKVSSLPEVDVVAMSNPGCQAWIEQGCQDHRKPIRVLHTLELLEEAFNSAS